MNITIEINDAVATNALSSWVTVERIKAGSADERSRINADCQQFGLQQTTMQSILTFIGNAILGYLQENANTATTSLIPLLINFLGRSAAQTPSTAASIPKDKFDFDVAKIRIKDNEEQKPTQPEKPETPVG